MICHYLIFIIVAASRNAVLKNLFMFAENLWPHCLTFQCGAYDYRTGHLRFDGMVRFRWMTYVLSTLKYSESEAGQEITCCQQSCNRSQLPTRSFCGNRQDYSRFLAKKTFFNYLLVQLRIQDVPERAQTPVGVSTYYLAIFFPKTALK